MDLSFCRKGIVFLIRLRRLRDGRVTTPETTLTKSLIREIFPHMEELPESSTLDARIARHLRMLRTERGWSLDDLASRSGVSRATLSRMENAEVSPTAAALGKLCAVHGITLSRLMHLAEAEFAPLVPRSSQAVWRDRSVGFERRSVSPPSAALAAELIECSIEAGMRIEYQASPRPGLEHHLLLREGALAVTIEGIEHKLQAGDCLRYRLFGETVFETGPDEGARYLLVLV